MASLVCDNENKTFNINDKINWVGKFLIQIYTLKLHCNRLIRITVHLVIEN